MTSYTKPGYSPAASNEYGEPLRIEVNEDVKKGKYGNYYEPEMNSSIERSRKPVNLAVCPHCARQHIRTRTKTHPNAATWAGVAVGAVIFLPLAVVPLVSDSMKKTDHYCQACGNKIGSVKPFEGCFVKERS